jgi:hypothetical protein
MNPELIVFGIRAAIRLASATDKAYTQHARDKAVLLPSAKVTPAAKNALIVEVFVDGEHSALVAEGGRLAGYWKNGRPNRDMEDAFAILMAEARQLKVEGGSGSSTTALSDRTRELAGAIMIEQWAEDKGPIQPLGRMVLVMTDIALDYFAANPGVLGIGGNGEKLIAAFAFNLEQLIPDDAENFGPKSQFAERMVQIVLSAGLETFQENPALIVNEEHLQKLIVSSLPSVIEALPAKLSEQSKWQDVADALLQRRHSNHRRESKGVSRIRVCHRQGFRRLDQCPFDPGCQNGPGETIQRGRVHKSLPLCARSCGSAP